MHSSTCTLMAATHCAPSFSGKVFGTCTHLQVSKGEAARVREREVARLLGSRRLVLILDLDHTLLHSVRLAEVRVDLDRTAANILLALAARDL